MNNTYEEKLLAFEPEIRAMVRNAIRHGHQYPSHDEDDLVQELMLEGIRAKDQYDPTKGKLSTFWYTYFRTRLMHISFGKKRAECYVGTFHDLDAIAGPMLIDTLSQLTFSDAVDALISYLQGSKPILADVCRTLLETHGNRKMAAERLGISYWNLTYLIGQTRVRLEPFREQIVSIYLQKRWHKTV